MPVVISHVGSKCATARLNHELYSKLYSYDHEVVSEVRDTPEVLEGLSRYAVIRNRLGLLPKGDWLFYLDGNTAIHRPVAVDDLLGSADRLLVALFGTEPPEPAKGLMVWRNTAENRDILLQLDILKGQEFAHATIEPGETDLLRRVGLLPVHGKRNDRIVATRGRVMNWQNLESFAVCFDKLNDDKNSHIYSEYLPYREFAMKRINIALEKGLVVNFATNEETGADDGYSSLNERSSVGLVTLSTPNISCYAKINEANVTRYCKRHNLAYHVYRNYPSDAPEGVSGAWLKPSLLLKHLEHHEWVVWIDADMLFIDQSQSLVSKLAGRDIMVARDIAGWSFNSGFLAFRNTEDNKRILREISAIIDGVADKSSTYINGGDQFVFNRYFEDNGLITEKNVCDYFTVNTHFCFANEDTYLSHFMGLGEPMRSCMMEDFERLSLEAGR